MAGELFASIILLHSALNILEIMFFPKGPVLTNMSLKDNTEKKRCSASDKLIRKNK